MFVESGGGGWSQPPSEERRSSEERRRVDKSPPPGEESRSGEERRRSKQAPKIQVGRVIGAVLFLALIFIAAIIAKYLEMQAWDTVLLHTFEVLVGGSVGLLTGEIHAARA